MDESPEMLRILELQTGDIIFSTSKGLVSAGIRIATKSSFSHASIYYEDGVILEANDDGVQARKIEICGLTNEGELIGLPYREWESLSVLRLTEVSQENWRLAIENAIKKQMGLDFPPNTVMVSGGPWFVRPIFWPFALALDFCDWCLNREAMAYDSWCSRLVGAVLTTQNLKQLTFAQRRSLRNASPQVLYQVAANVGYEVIEGAVAKDYQIQAPPPLSSAFATKQNETYGHWASVSQQNRDDVRKERTFLELRSTRKLVALLGICAVIALVLFWPSKRYPPPLCSPLTEATHRSSIEAVQNAEPTLRHDFGDQFLFWSKDGPKAFAEVLIASSAKLIELENLLSSPLPSKGGIYFVYAPGGSGKTPYVTYVREKYSDRCEYVNLTIPNDELKIGTSPWATRKPELRLAGKDASWQPYLNESALKDGLTGFIAKYTNVESPLKPIILIDGLDELHPDSAVLILRKVREYSVENQNSVIVVAARGEAFRDYFLETDYRAVNEIRLPNIYLGDKKSQLWYAGNYLSFKNSRKLSEITLTESKELQGGLTKLTEKHPFIRHFLYPGALGNFAFEGVRYTTKGGDRLEALMFQSLLERNRKTHNRPDKNDSEVWPIYKNALVQIARRYAPDVNGMFLVGPDDSVCVIDDLRPVKVNVGNILMRSGLIDLNPINVQYLECRFWPQTLHLFLANGNFD